MLVAAQIIRMVSRILQRPPNSQPLAYTDFLPVIQSNTNLGVAVKGFCDVMRDPNQLILR